VHSQTLIRLQSGTPRPRETAGIQFQVGVRSIAVVAGECRRHCILGHVRYSTAKIELSEVEARIRAEMKAGRPTGTRTHASALRFIMRLSKYTVRVAPIRLGNLGPRKRAETKAGDDPKWRWGEGLTPGICNVRVSPIPRAPHLCRNEGQKTVHNAPKGGRCGRTLAVRVSPIACRKSRVLCDGGEYFPRCIAFHERACRVSRRTPKISPTRTRRTHLR
jgi:hypothetical protein